MHPIPLALLSTALAAPVLAQACTKATLGTAAQDRLGWSSAVIGDVDQDGVPDYAVGVPQASNPANSSGQVGNGKVVVYSGNTGLALYTVLGPATSSMFGFAVAGLGDRDGDGLADPGFGDVDGDGTPDFAVGAPTETVPGASETGACYVVSGRTGAILRRIQDTTTLPNGHLGWSLSCAGDQNGDGRPELLVGMPGYSVTGSGGRGLAALVNVTPTTASTIATMVGAQSKDGIGFSCASCRDIDADGKPELLIGSRDLQEVRIVKSSALPAMTYTSITHTAVGFAECISPVGDLDGDGKGDFAVSAPECVAGTSCITPGRVIVYSGASRTPLRTWLGRRPGDEFGCALSVCPDLDGDGRPELLVGARSSDPLGTNSAVADAGETRIYGSSTGNELTELIGEAKERLGGSVLGLGYLPAFGTHVFVVGSPDASSGSTAKVGKVTRYHAAAQSTWFGRGSTTSFGQVPVIHEGGDGPCIGTSNYRIYASRVPASGPALLAIGDSRSAWGSLALPITNFLRVGCDLNVAPLVQIPTTQSGQFSPWGQAEALLPIPNQPSLRGVVLYCQFVATDSLLSQPAPYIAMSRGMRVVLR